MLIQSSIDNDVKPISIISMPYSEMPLNSCDLKKFASEHSIPYFTATDINSIKTEQYIKSLYPDFIISSWPKMIKPNILDIPKHFIIGTHYSNLPYNRGCHPLHWQIHMGISHTYVNFFKMDEHIDNGDIIYRKKLTISSFETIESLNQKVNLVAYKSFKIVLSLLKKNTYKFMKQKKVSTNFYLRKRNLFDTLIDVRMSYDIIKNIVRSYSEPYPCATILVENILFKIRCVKKHKINKFDKYISMGKIITIKDKIIVIKVYDRLMQIETLETIPKYFFNIKNIYPPSFYLNKYDKNEIKGLN